MPSNPHPTKIKKSGNSFQKNVASCEILLTFSEKNTMTEKDRLEFVTDFFNRCENTFELELKDYSHKTRKTVSCCYVGVTVHALKKSINREARFIMRNNYGEQCGYIRVSGYTGINHKYTFQRK